MGELQTIPFDMNSLPALAAAFASVSDDEFSTGQKPSFPVLRIGGKVWAVTKGKDRFVIKDAENLPTRTVEVIVLRTTPGLSNAWYEKPFNPENPVPPDCYSNAGDKPAPDSKHPQATSCAACPHFVWGPQPTETPGVFRNGRACSQSKRLAVVKPDALDEPMLLNVPPDSFKPWEAFVKWLKDHGVKPPSVVVKLSFDPEANHPRIIFAPVATVKPEYAPAVLAARESDAAKAITGVTAVPGEHVDTPAAAPAPAPAPAAPAPAPAPAAPAPAPAPAAPATAPAAAPKDDILAAIEGLDAALGDLNFGALSA